MRAAVPHNSGMEEPLAYLNGRYLPASQLTIPPTDAGFVLGATVAEQLRTFRGRLFRPEDHLRRLEQSLAVVGIEIGLSRGKLGAIAQRLVAENHARLDPADDLGLSIFVTPGTYAAYAENAAQGPCVGMHTYRLPFHLWAEKYRTGQVLVTTSIRQVPAECWPARLKCRSRMHYFLADRQAAARQPGARALLLDAQDHVTETSTANVLAFYGDVGLVSPPLDMILPGISLAVIAELAGELNIPLSFRSFGVEELARADEVLLASTPFCLLPVTQLDGRPIGSGRPGPVFGRLLDAWGQMAGLDIAAQARRFAEQRRCAAD